MKFLYTIVLLLLIPTLASADKRVISAVTDPWPVLLDPESATQGLISEIARAALHSQGYDLQVTFVPWARAMDMIKNKRADLLIGAWYTEERNVYLQYSKPIFSSEIRFIKAKNSTFNYEGINSLQGKRIGTILGYQYETAFLQAKSVERIESDSLLNNIRNLIAGRIDLTLDDHYVMRFMLDRHIPSWQDRISFVDNPLTDKEVFLAANRSNPEHQALINAFNTGLKKLKKSGRYQEIISSYQLED